MRTHQLAIWELWGVDKIHILCSFVDLEEDVSSFYPWVAGKRVTRWFLGGTPSDLRRVVEGITVSRVWRACGTRLGLAAWKKRCEGVCDPDGFGPARFSIQATGSVPHGRPPPTHSSTPTPNPAIGFPPPHNFFRFPLLVPLPVRASRRPPVVYVLLFCKLTPTLVLFFFTRTDSSPPNASSSSLVTPYCYRFPSTRN